MNDINELKADYKNSKQHSVFADVDDEILGASHLRTEKDARKLVAIAVVAGGYGGDRSEELCNELLDDIDYHYIKVKCRKIKAMIPKLQKMVEEELKTSARFAAN